MTHHGKGRTQRTLAKPLESTDQNRQNTAIKSLMEQVRFLQSPPSADEWETIPPEEKAALKGLAERIRVLLEHPPAGEWEKISQGNAALKSWAEFAGLQLPQLSPEDCEKLLQQGFRTLDTVSGESGREAAESPGDLAAGAKTNVVDAGREPQIELIGTGQILDGINNLSASGSGLGAKSERSSKVLNPESETLESPRKRKRGPPANLKRHRAIAKILKPYGQKCPRDASNLKKIAEKFDKNPRLIPPPKTYPSWKKAAQERHGRELMIKYISRSLAWIEKNSR
jgi:hypothetical protein